MEISAPADKASMNCLVPDRAMVPRLFTKSDLVKPIPVSWITKVLPSLSGMMEILRSFSLSSTDGSDRELYLILSSASEALEINSRRKTVIQLALQILNAETNMIRTLFIRVNCINDKGEELRNFSLELERLSRPEPQEY